MGTVTILTETTKNPCNFPTVILKKDDGTEVKFKKGIPRSKLKGYSPDNCRFATAKEQCRNRRNNRKVARLSESGDVLEVYGSIAEAEEKMGGSIGGHLCGV